jgi:hypothetical protein
VADAAARVSETAGDGEGTAASRMPETAGAGEGSVDEVLRGYASWCVVHGDALHVLRELPAESVDAFVTDPPYSSGGAFRGDRVKETTAKYVSTKSANKEIPAFEGDVRDQRSFTLWTALWSSEAWRAGAEGCHLVAFSDWRQLPSLCDAVQAGGWLWRGIADLVSLYRSLSSTWNHESAIVARISTRTTSSRATGSKRMHDLRKLEMFGVNEPRSMRGDLSSGQYSVLDQRAHDVVRHAEFFRDLDHGEPPRALIRAWNAGFSPIARHAFSVPRVAVPGAHSEAVESHRDLRVAPPSSHLSDEFASFDGCAPLVVTTLGLAYSQLGVLPAAPVDHEDDFARLFVDVDDDLLDECTHDALLRSHVGAGRVPDHLEIGGEAEQCVTVNRRRPMLLIDDEACFAFT